MTSQQSSADIKTGQFMFSYSQLCGQKPVKTTQMLRFCRRQQAASGTSSRSSSAEQGERKAGTTLSPPCQPRCTEGQANGRIFFPEAVVGSDQRQGLLLVKESTSKWRGAVTRQGEATEWLSMVSACTSAAKVTGRTNLLNEKFFPALTVGFSSRQVLNATYKHVPARGSLGFKSPVALTFSLRLLE